ncbi:MAG: serine/threonine protein kinase [Povalibacter sp.]
MDKNSAQARLGLTGGEDAIAITRAYGERLSTMQGRLVSAQTDAERAQHQSALSNLVEAYECLTSTGRYTPAPESNYDSTLGRSNAESSARHYESPMRTGAVLSSRLEIGDMLGQGGMGYVYAARDRLRNEDVAIKVLRQDLIFSSTAKERFLAEAKLSSNLSHPNIVRVYDVGESGGHYYLSMERLKGETLRQRIQAYQHDKRVFTVAEVTDVARQLIDALRYAHRYIVHRDLKPENVWLADDGTVKLMDFGIARAYSSAHMTQTGTTLGTAYYMAPEQRFDAKEVDWRADEYALGVIMYELLAGAIPMGALKALSQTRRDVPQRYSDAVMRAMSPRPEDRWLSLDAFLLAIQMPVRRSASAALWFLGLIVAAAAGAGVYYGGGFAAGREQVAANVPPGAQERARPMPAQPVTESAPVTTAATEQSVDESSPTADTSIAEKAPTPTIIEPALKSAAVVQTDSTETVRMNKSAADTNTIKTASINPANTHRQECMTQCERDDGQCRSINRRGKQDCMRAVGFGATGGFTAAPSNRIAECGFYTQARCRYAPDRDACLARIGSRYNDCVNVLSGSVASRREDCDVKARDADDLCLNELRDCRSYCN